MKLKNSKERQIWIDGLFSGALIIVLIILSSKLFIKAIDISDEIPILINLVAGFLGMIMIISIIFILIKFWKVVKDEFKSR